MPTTLEVQCDLRNKAMHNLQQNGAIMVLHLLHQWVAHSTPTVNSDAGHN
jgi:hypothetical protein